MLFDRLHQLFVAVQDHITRNGGVVRSADNPGRLLLGFSVEDTQWEIKLTSVARGRFGCFGVPDDILRLLSTTAGRAEIARRLSEGTVFESA